MIGEQEKQEESEQAEKSVVEDLRDRVCAVYEVLWTNVLSQLHHPLDRYASYVAMVAVTKVFAVHHDKDVVEKLNLLADTFLRAVDTAVAEAVIAEKDKTPGC